MITGRLVFYAVCIIITAVGVCSGASSPSVQFVASPPKQWVDDPTINFRSVAVDDNLKKPLLACVQSAVDLLQSESAKALVKEITVCWSISFRGVIAGGTNSDVGIYVAVASPEGQLLSCRSIRHLVIHEWSSLALRNFDHKHLEEEWRKLLPQDFAYYSDGVTAIKADPRLADASVSSVNLLDRGFISRYSQASFENDFNEIAAWLITNYDYFISICSKHGLLAEKRDLAMQFFVDNLRWRPTSSEYVGTRDKQEPKDIKVISKLSNRPRFVLLNLGSLELRDEQPLSHLDIEGDPLFYPSLCALDEAVGGGFMSCDIRLRQNQLACERCYPFEAAARGHCIGRAVLLFKLCMR